VATTDLSVDRTDKAT